MIGPTRRRFLTTGFAIAGVGLASGCGLLPTPLRPSARVPRIGWVGLDPELSAPYRAEFQRGMRERGWIEGENVAFEFRWTAGNAERARAAVAELIDLHVDLLVIPSNTPAVCAAKEGTSTTPILFIGVADPVAVGLVDSLARPGGNLTGFSDRATSSAAKQVQLLKETLPGLARLTILWQSDNPSLSPLFAEADGAARGLGLDVLALGATSEGDLEPAFGRAATWHADGLCLIDSGFLWTFRGRIVGLAASTHLPSIYVSRDYAHAGGLMSYGPSVISLFRLAPDYADKILRGAKPADLPVQGMTTWDFVINLKAAQALDITIPQSVLAQATEIIQ
jgi:putative ABC transport system substrate-binding protein